jgi:hypothetical protein
MRADETVNGDIIMCAHERLGLRQHPITKTFPTGMHGND